MSPLQRPLAVALIAGVLFLGVGALLHPNLEGSADDHLRLIARTPYWRVIHLVMLLGSGLIAVGIWARTQLPGGTVSPALLAALGLVTVGICLNALNIGYMAGAGWHMASMFGTGSAQMSAIYDATHPIGQIAARFGNLVVALAAIMLGVIERHEGQRVPSWFAWAAGVGGLIGACFFNEASPAALAAVALLTGWELTVASRSFRAQA